MRATLFRTTAAGLAAASLAAPVEAATLLQAAGGVSPSSRVRLLRSTSGSKGSVQGSRYVIEDPREVFHVPADRSIVVYFEWQAAPGLHKCEGTWKDPSGKGVLTSSSEYSSRGPRFGLYWTLSLPDTVAAGRWTLEARVDGEAAGSHSFEIRAAEGTPAASSRRPLLPGEAYKRGLELSLSVEARDAAGKRLGVGSGFLLRPGVLLTAFETINAARTVQITGADGARAESTALIAWDRSAGWAALAVATSAPRDPPSPAPSLQVGDRCSFLDLQDDGSRVLIDASVVGEMKNGRLNLAPAGSESSAGAPVLNEYGEVVGMIGGSGILGASVLDVSSLGGFAMRGAGAIPLKAVRVPDAGTPTPLGDLEARGEFVRPVARTPHIVTGVFGRAVENRGIPMAIDQRFQFTRADGEAIAFVTWSPRRKEDAAVKFQLFDESGRPLRESPPAKVRLRPGETFVQSWKVKVGALPPGIYRVDVLLADDPVLRLFLRVVE